MTPQSHFEPPSNMYTLTSWIHSSLHFKPRTRRRCLRCVELTFSRKQPLSWQSKVLSDRPFRIFLSSIACVVLTSGNLISQSVTWLNIYQVNTYLFWIVLEIHAVNESEAYLGILIHEIGLDLKTVAHCAQIRCIRQSHFTLEDSLLRRHWNIESILGNMGLCKKIVHSHPEILHQLEPALREEK